MTPGPAPASGSPGAAAPAAPEPRPVPADVTDVLLIRHAEPQWLAPGAAIQITGGYADPELSAHGHRQAAALAQRPALLQVSALYVTTLRRTAETAAPLAQRLGLHPEVEPGLTEVNLGEWEGRYHEKVAQADPLVAEVFARQSWDVIPGAEPAPRLEARVREAVDRLAGAHRGRRIAVVSHGGVIALILALATGSRRFAFIAPDLASVSRLSVTEDHWAIRGFNDTAHLEIPPAR